mmetsp:Transcript_17385/g.19612  ORF Transcript_17385/g.19612 Transcript_17385/m.19612 type:complete len:116 (+) Transcript_17385:159-506(+)
MVALEFREGVLREVGKRMTQRLVRNTTKDCFNFELASNNSSRDPQTNQTKIECLKKSEKEDQRITLPQLKKLLFFACLYPQRISRVINIVIAVDRALLLCFSSSFNKEVDTNSAH